MATQGSVVSEFGALKVVESVEDQGDGQTKVVGHFVIGPGADSSVTHATLEAAEAKAKELDDSSKSKNDDVSDRKSKISRRNRP